MAYQPWLQERIDKFKTFFADERPGQILITLALWEMGIDFREYGVQGRPLDAWDFETDVEAFTICSACTFTGKSPRFGD